MYIHFTLTMYFFLLFQQEKNIFPYVFYIYSGSMYNAATQRS